ncbi:MAG: hypothetical protein ACR2MX_01125 [Cyclobacteriaceae bacterium]
MTAIPTNNLNTFRILFIVKGILTLVVSFFPLVYIAMGVFLGSAAFTEANNPPPFNIGIIFVIMGAFFFVLLVALGIVTLFAAKYLNEIRNYNFIFVVAILNCLTGVLGILLGVFTLIELNKPEVKVLFEKS